MSGEDTARLAGPSGPLVRFLFLSLVSVVVLLPPEARGESAAGCAFLVALLAIVCVRDTAGSGPLLAAIAAAGALLTVPSSAPGNAVAPLSAALIAVFLGWAAARRSADLRATETVPWVLTLAAVAVSLYALYQYFWGLSSAAARIEGLGVPDEGLVVARLRQGRPFAGFATPAALGGYLAFVLPISAGLALAHRGRRRVSAIAAMLVCACALAATASGTAVAALCGGTALTLFRRRAGRRRLLATAAVAAFLLVAAVVASRGLKVLDPTDTAGPWRLRAGNIRIAARMVAEHPWTGVGLGAFGEAFPAYRRAGDNESRHAHDLPAEMLAETGIVTGTLVSIAFLGLFLGPAWRAGSRRFDWTAGAAAGLAAFALQNLADFTAYCPSLLWVAAVVAGTLGEAGADPPPRRVPPGPAVAMLATTGIACWAFACNGLGWNAYVESREQAAFGQWSRARERADAAIALAPWDVDARLLRAELNLSRIEPGPAAGGPELQAVLEDTNAALSLAPSRPSAHALRARVRLARNDLPGAYADLCAAARLYPLQADYANQRDAVEARLPRRDPGGGS